MWLEVCSMLRYAAIRLLIGVLPLEGLEAAVACLWRLPMFLANGQTPQVNVLNVGIVRSRETARTKLYKHSALTWLEKGAALGHGDELTRQQARWSFSARHAVMKSPRPAARGDRHPVANACSPVRHRPSLMGSVTWPNLACM